MKLTKRQLRRIIRESLLTEASSTPMVTVVKDAWETVDNELGIGEDGWEEAIVDKVIEDNPDYLGPHKEGMVGSLTYRGADMEVDEELMKSLLQHIKQKIDGAKAR